MGRVFVTSDTHWNHDNILKLGAGRPFETIVEMNETFIDNWNSVVGEDDEVWHLGDVFYPAKRADHITLDELADRLHGTKHLVCGNHDYERMVGINGNEVAARKHSMWSSVQDYAEFKFGKTRFVFQHYPIHSWRNAHRDWLHLHGHLHTPKKWWLNPESKNYRSHRMDVGVDSGSFTPWNLEDVRGILFAQDHDDSDHHNEE